MSDPTPVPLTDIEDACRSNEATGVTGGGWSAWQDLANPDEDRNHYIKGGGWAVAQSITEDDARYIATADPPTVLALCEALRIAVEGLDRVERWYVCKNVPDDDGDFITCRGFTDDSTGWCGWCCALDAIESVRELVDLGEKP